MEPKLVKAEDIVKNGTDAQAAIVEASDIFVKTLEKYNVTYFFVINMKRDSVNDLCFASSSVYEKEKTNEERIAELTKINYCLLTLGANLVIVHPSMVNPPNEPNKPDFN